MNIPNNARSAGSRARIKAALVNLLERKTPDAITVQEVCKLAEVNRTTFYAHFTNVRDLFEALEADLYYDAEDRILPKTSDVSQLISRDTMLRILTYVRQNEALYRVYLTELTESKLINEFSELIRNIYVMPALQKSSVFAAAEYEYYFEFCKAGTLAMMKMWLLSGCEEPEKNVAELIEKILKRCMP